MLHLDETILKMIYRILGDLMIKHRINLMPYWIWMRDAVEENVILPLNLVDIDYCRAMTLPVRLLCIVGMLVMNTYMIASFLRGMQESGSVVATSLSTAANFVASAIYGAVVWKERMNVQWCAGFGCVLLGVVILSNTAPQPEDEEKPSAQQRFKRSIAKNGSDRYESRDLQLSSRPKSTIKTPPPKIERGTVATMKKRFTETSSKLNGNMTTKSPSSPPINKARKLVRAKQQEVKSNTAPTSPPPSLDDTTKSLSLPKNKNSKLKPESSLKQYYPCSCNRQFDSQLIDHGFLNECAVCDMVMFDCTTGRAFDEANVADLSPNTCFHVFHAKCLKQCSKAFGNACPLCQKPLTMWTTSKQAAQFPGFWLHRIDEYLLTFKDPPSNPSNGKPKCLDAWKIREHFAQDASLTEEQKVFISDDPSGMGKGLQAALEWGGYRDYNQVPKGHKGFLDCLRTKGLWKYDPKKDDIWFWKWGHIHPRQRCAQCQLLKHPLPIECQGCHGSAEVALYCSEACSKRDWQRHKQTCQEWQVLGLTL
jgi:hypothetical protein